MRAWRWGVRAFPVLLSGLLAGCAGQLASPGDPALERPDKAAAKKPSLAPVAPPEKQLIAAVDPSQSIFFTPGGTTINS